jgi:hypothetical protein
MTTPNIQPRITISRVSAVKDYISINITDDTTRLHIIRINMAFEDLAKALTGQGEMPAKLDRWCGKGAAHLGRTYEEKSLHVPEPRVYLPPDRLYAYVIRSHKVTSAIRNGWVIDGTNIGSRREARTVTVFMRRYDKGEDE